MDARALLVLLGLSVALPALPATIIVNAGAGFDDITPTVPVAGNTGITRGEQRLIVFQRAAQIWGERLHSSQTIAVDATFTNLTCSETSATLGSAGPNFVFFFEPPNPVPPNSLEGYWYPMALAEALADFDLTSLFGPGEVEIGAQFNAAIDEGCFGGGTWWYGIDPNVPPADGTVALLPVVLHEMAHGLGFLSFSCVTDEADCGTCSNPDGCGDGIVNGAPIPNGQRLGGRYDVWDYFLLDVDADAFWDGMGTAERAASMRNDPKLVWGGSTVDQLSSTFQPGLDGIDPESGLVRMHAPATVEPGSSVAHFSTAAGSPDLLMEPTLQPGVFADPDLTVALFQDIGWQLLDGAGDALFADGFEG